jgi:hypothetical protein
MTNVPWLLGPRSAMLAQMEGTMLGVWAVLWWGWAAAGEVSTEVVGSLVRGQAVLAVPPARFLAELEDPAWVSRVSQSKTQVSVVGPDGACTRVAFLSPNAIFDARYEVRRCRTPHGWENALLTSNAFETYRAGWHVAPHPEGTLATYEVDLTTSLWVPNSLVRGETRRSIRKLLKAIASWADAQSTSAVAE